MYALSSYRAKCVTKIMGKEAGGDSIQLATLSAEKPMLMRYDAWTSRSPVDTDLKAVQKSPPDTVYASEGKHLIWLSGNAYQTKEPVTPDDLHTTLEPWDGFYSKKTSIASKLLAASTAEAPIATKYAGSADVGGVACDMVEVKVFRDHMGAKVEFRATYYIGREDRLVRRLTQLVASGGALQLSTDAVISDIDTSHPGSRSLYAFTPPKGAVEEGVEAPLLSAGSRAPNFIARDGDNHAVRLEDLRGKVVVLDFWASWCGPCMMSMPHTNEVAGAFNSSAVFLAVDDGEGEDGFKQWVASNRTKYPKLRFVHVDPSQKLSSGSYHVSGIPTQYVIDKKGIVRASFVGYNEDEAPLREAIKRAGAG
jgi:thiol-disulfide isomerase/thioredoxin